MSLPICNSFLSTCKKVGETANMEDTFCTSHIGPYIISIALILLLIVLFFIVVRKYGRFQSFNISIGGGIFVVGLLLYVYGFYDEGTGRFPYIALWLRACMSSLEMFISHSDLIEVRNGAKEDVVYMTLFSVTHALAIMFSAYIAISYLGLRMFAKLKYWAMYKLQNRKIDTLNVFMNYSDNAFLLADDWRKHKGRRHRLLTVFVSQQKQNLQTTGRFSITRVIDMFSATSSKEMVEHVNSINGMLVYANNKKDIKDDVDTFSRIGIPNIDHLMKLAKEVNLFVISDDWNGNMVFAVHLCNLIINNPIDSEKVRIYCQARREPMNKVYELNYKFLRIVDTSYLSVKILKGITYSAENNKGLVECYKYHPVNYVDVDTENGLAKSGFNCLVVGFGETGQDTLRFLYEMGQLPMEKEKRIVSGFHGYVIDKNMNSLKGMFFQECPSLNKSGKNDLGSIEYIEEDFCNESFWEKMKDLISTLNYVVITIGNEEEGLRLAIALSDLAMRYGRDDPSRFKIFVRSYHKENEIRLAQIINNYQFIEFFGITSQLYTKDNFDESENKSKADKFGKEYNKVYIQVQKLINEAYKSPKQVLDERLKSQKKFRQDWQNIENVYHIYTKLVLADMIQKNGSIADISEDINNYIQEVQSSHYENLLSSKSASCSPQYIENIAICEHLRWWASHESIGYVPMPLDKYSGETADERMKQHVCMVPWDDLDNLTPQNHQIEVYKAYDRLTVYTTFVIIRNIMKNKDLEKS